MRGSQNSTDGLALWFMQIRGLKKGEKVYMKQTKALGDKKYEEQKETIREISGDLHDIKFRDYEYEGDTITELQLWLKDLKEKELYVVSVNVNSIARSIMNSLLSIEGEIGHLLIRVYNKKDTGYAGVYMEHNGSQIGWKYKPQETEHLVVENTVKKKGQTVVEKDFTEVDNMLMKELKENVIPNIKKSSNSAPAKQESEPAPETITADDGDDLPF